MITHFINNPVKVAVGVLLIVLFGLIAVFQMPVELTPQVEQQWLSVSTMWPGAGPEEIEREIVYEQEKQLKAVPGMKYIESTCSNSRARVSMGFDVGTDMNEALVKVNSRLQQVSRYPETALEPTITSGTDRTPEIANFNIIPRPPTHEQLDEFAEQNPGLKTRIDEAKRLTPPTVMLERLQALAEEHPQIVPLLPTVDVIEQTQFVEDYIEAAFGRVPGVARTWVWGGKRREMRVIVDPGKLAALGLRLTDVRAVLRERNRDAPAGQLNEGKRKFDVRVMGRYTTPEQIENEVVTVVNGAPVYIRDLATVQLAYRATLDSAATHFATDCLRLGVVKEPGANILEVMEGLVKVRDELNEGVLKKRGLLLYQSYDDTDYINAAIGSVQFNMLLGAVLTTIVLLLFLRSVRSTLIVGLAIPVSIVGTFLCLRLFGRSLNVVSLAGMSFAIGMLVDNAVVVLENIYRHHQLGATRVEAAQRGTSEVWGATLASTLTTLAVFIPILFVRQEAGQLFRDIALAISCGVGLSLVVSVIVIPTAAAQFLGQRPENAAPQVAGRVAGSGRRHGSFSLVKRIMQPIDTLAGMLSSSVVRLNRRLQRSVWIQVSNVVLFVVGAILLAYFLMPSVEYLPNGNRNSVRGSLVLPAGYNTDQILSVGNSYYQRVRPFVEREGGDLWQAKSETLQRSKTSPNKTSPNKTSLNKTSPNKILPDKTLPNKIPPQIVDYTYGAYMGRGYLSAKSKEPLRAGELIPLLESLAGSLPGVEAHLNQLGLFSSGWVSTGRVIEVHVLGPDLVQLVDLAKQVRTRLANVMPDARALPRPSLEMGKPELRVLPDKLRAAEAGLTNSEIGFTVDAFIDSAYADKYILDGDEIDLALAMKSDGQGEGNLEEVPIPTADGTIVPLSALADIKLSSSLESIQRINRERAITLNVTPPAGIPLAEAIRIIEDEIVAPLEESGELDGLYRIRMSGTADKLRDTWAALRTNLLIAVLITYLLMAALFESWSYPLVIMVSLPLAAVGGIVGLRVIGLFTTQHLDIITMLGFVILIGTVVNNAILIVHQSLNYMRLEGDAPNDAVVKSVATRIRPIFMTSITTTFGLLPLVLIQGAGAELYRGLGSVVLGGLLLSTVFTLFLVPSLFSLMHLFSASVSKKLGRIPSSEIIIDSPSIDVARKSSPPSVTPVN